ncbi:MAG: hypothetical protein RL030_918 [Pseudomonadota bacterium]
MKASKNWLLATLALLLPLAATAASDYFLKIEDLKGESRVVHCTDGSCLVDKLAPGTFKVQISDAQGKVIPSDMRLEFTVVTARERGSGLATGKRMHQPLTLTMQLGRSAAPTNTIAVDEPGTLVVIGVDAASVDAAVAKITKTRSNIQNN